MNMTIRNWLERSKRRIAARIDRDRFPQECPVFSVSNIHYDVSTRTRAISAGGTGSWVLAKERKKILRPSLDLPTGGSPTFHAVDNREPDSWDPSLHCAKGNRT